MKILIFVGLLHCLTTCTKLGKNVTIKGRVYNPITNEGIPNVKIRLTRNKWTLSWEGDSKELKTKHTDAEGYYEVDKLALAFGEINLRIQTDKNYYDLGYLYEGELKKTSTGQLTVKRGKTMKVDYQAVPYVNFSKHYKNTNCFDLNDKVILFYDGSDYESNTFQVGKHGEVFGCADVKTDPIKISAGKKYFHWVATKNGISQTYYDTIDLKEGQDNVLDVFY